MLDQKQLETIKETVEKFFEKTSFEAEINVFLEKNESVFIDVKVDQPQILIGEKGQTLTEIQYLLRIILRKKIAELFYVNLDINKYKEKKYQFLKEMAVSLANEVVFNKEEKVLPVMPSFERKIIHSELSEREDVTTESIGKEPERKIIIKPKN